MPSEVIYTEEYNALILQILLFSVALVCVIVYACMKQDWAKNTDEDGDHHHLKEKHDKEGFNQEMSALFQPKENSISEPFLGKNSETMMEPFRFGKLIGEKGGEISVI